MPKIGVAKAACIGSFISVAKLAIKLQLENDCAAQIAKLDSETTAYQKKLAEYSKGIKDLYVEKVKGVDFRGGVSGIVR